ncbi:hypothetical protein ACO2FP_12070 [Staphylococcus warneri]
MKFKKSNATTTQQINTSSQDSTPRAHIEQQLSKDDTTTSLPEDKTIHTSSNNNNDNSQNISLHKEERAKHQNKVDDTNTQSNGNNRNDLVNKKCYKHNFLSFKYTTRTTKFKYQGTSS